MKRNGIAILLTLLVCLLLLFPSTACTVRGPGATVRVGDAPPGPPPPVGPPPPPPPHKVGPPPHAPAHGYRAKHTYHYYPDNHVYFDTSRELYFYLDEGKWRASVSLPRHLHIHLGEHVTIQMDSDRPYTQYKAHKKKYPPGQMKKKKMKRNWKWR